jgi:acyl carrier protein
VGVDVTTSPIATDDIVRALVGRVVQLFGLTVDIDVVEGDAEFMGDDVLSIGGHTFDSMDLLEILVTLEDELGVALIDDIDLDGLGTLRSFAERAGTQSPPEQLAAFVQRWTIAGLSVTSKASG